MCIVSAEIVKILSVTVIPMFSICYYIKRRNQNKMTFHFILPKTKEKNLHRYNNMLCEKSPSTTDYFSRTFAEFDSLPRLPIQ